MILLKKYLIIYQDGSNVFRHPGKDPHNRSRPDLLKMATKVGSQAHGPTHTQFTGGRGMEVMGVGVGTGHPLPEPVPSWQRGAC